MKRRLGHLAQSDAHASIALNGAAMAPFHTNG
jgi:hypothetical protein